jgi:hypothetical protein
MWDAIQQMDVWSPTCFSDGRDRFKYLSLAVTLVFVSLPRRRQGNLRFPLTYTYHGGHGSVGCGELAGVGALEKFTTCPGCARMDRLTIGPQVANLPHKLSKKLPTVGEL